MDHARFVFFVMVFVLLSFLFVGAGSILWEAWKCRSRKEEDLRFLRLMLSRSFTIEDRLLLSEHAYRLGCCHEFLEMLKTAPKLLWTRCETDGNRIWLCRKETGVDMLIH